MEVDAPMSANRIAGFAAADWANVSWLKTGLADASMLQLLGFCGLPMIPMRLSKSTPSLPGLSSASVWAMLSKLHNNGDLFGAKKAEHASSKVQKQQHFSFLYLLSHPSMTSTTNLQLRKGEAPPSVPVAIV